jgi:hypothetical protein
MHVVPVCITLTSYKFGHDASMVIIPLVLHRAFAVMAQQVAGDTQTKMKRLSREMRNLRGKTSLPIHMASSIFVRHDTDRMDKVRALITGNRASSRSSAL